MQKKLTIAAAAFSASILCASTATAEDSMTPGGTFLMSLLGSTPFALAAISMFFKSAYGRGSKDKADEQVLKDLADIKAEIKGLGGRFASKEELLSLRVENDKEHEHFENRESLVLRLQTMEAKIERDVERFMRRGDRKD